jgi:hypothetical protein
MNLSFRTLGLVLLLGSALSCGDGDHDDDDGHHGDGDGDGDASDAGQDLEGLRQCCYIGEICHEGSEGNEEVAACHDLGHENDPTACRAEFDRCKTLCDPEGTTTLPDHCEDPSGNPH